MDESDAAACSLVLRAAEEEGMLGLVAVIANILRAEHVPASRTYTIVVIISLVLTCELLRRVVRLVSPAVKPCIGNFRRILAIGVEGHIVLLGRMLADWHNLILISLLHSSLVPAIGSLEE